MAEDDKRRPGEPAQEDREAGFLGRWARRKQESRAKEPEGESKDAPTSVERGAAVAERSAEVGGEAVDPETLPDPDELPADADWSVFMRQGVPEALQRRALRRLWRLNPVFGHLDRLNDYDDDYTDAATVVQGLKSLYKVGKGMVSEEEEREQAARSDEPAGGEAADEESEAEVSETEAPPAEEAPSQPQSQSPEARDETAGREDSGKPARPGAKVGPVPPEGTRRRARRNADEGAQTSAAARRWKRFST